MNALPTTTIDHYPTDADVRRIEAEKDCKVVSAAPIYKTKTEHVITYKVNEKPKLGKNNRANKQPSPFF